MKDKKIDLGRDDFSYLCPLKTSNMKDVEGGYFCDKCEKKVHDVTGMSVAEYEELVGKSKDICVTFKKVATMTLAFSMAASAESKVESAKPLILAPTELKIKLKENNNTEKKQIIKFEQIKMGKVRRDKNQSNCLID